MSTAVQTGTSRGSAESNFGGRVSIPGQATRTTSPRTLARIAGALYLIVAVTAGYAEFYVRSLIGAPGTASTIADNVRTFATQFRIAFVVDLVQAIFFLLTTIALYALLRHVDRLIAVGMLAFVAVGVAVQCLNLLNQYTALTIATDASYTSTLGTAGSDTLTKLFVDMQLNGFHIAEIFFAWLIPLGYLVVKSGYFPKLIGALLIVGGLAYLVDFTAYFLFPSVATSVARILAASASAEVSFIVWLPVKGAKPVGPQSAAVGSKAPR